MSSIPTDLRYTKDHEYVRAGADGIVTVGISDFAQGELGDVVFLELPSPGRKLASRESFGVIESVKAAGDIYAPVTGEVVAINQDVIDAPESVNKDAFAAWLFKLKPANAAELDGLLDSAAYVKKIG